VPSPPIKVQGLPWTFSEAPTPIAASDRRVRGLELSHENKVVRARRSYDPPRWDGRIRADRHRSGCCRTFFRGTERDGGQAGHEFELLGSNSLGPL
jgi:hypothetical protein